VRNDTRGLCGYVGVDLIIPESMPRQPVVVEINPRLTTSYLGYRALAESNLAEWLLIPARFDRTIRWRTGAVEFDSPGDIKELSTDFADFHRL
jgi:predicted ATP-grasp superfamily ATP-dependent carboligase